MEPGTELTVPEYQPPADFKTVLEAATDKIKAYKAYFYDREPASPLFYVDG